MEIEPIVYKKKPCSHIKLEGEDLNYIEEIKQELYYIFKEWK